MSVLVKGMEMPENCIKCPLQFGGWCYASPPEIDERADALIRDHFSLEHRIALSEANKAWMRKIINDAPTIVESEDGT